MVRLPISRVLAFCNILDFAPWGCPPIVLSDVRKAISDGLFRPEPVPDDLSEWYQPHIDGNHRLYAAIMRGDTHIEATVDGDIDYAENLFGVPVY